MMSRGKLEPTPAKMESASDALSRSLAYTYAALDELQATESAVGGVRTGHAARTLAQAHLDDVVELVKRARALLSAIVASERGYEGAW
jgi:hypothetical protein